MRFIKTALTLVFLVAIYLQAANVTGEYCTENKEIKICYQFKAGNKVTLIMERFNMKLSSSGNYVQEGNSLTPVFDKIDDKNALLAFKKKSTMKTFDDQIEATCAVIVMQRQKHKGKLYPQTPQGVKDCVEDGNNEAEIKYQKQVFNAMKLSDSDIQLELKTINSQFSGNYFIVENSMHQLNEKCNSQFTVTKKGAKASTLVFNKDKQFCLNSRIYDKCDGSEYNPKMQVCKDNTVLSKCGQELYNPDLQYCSGGVLKDKGEFTDSRDGKIYKTVAIGNQTWMAENLNYAGESGKLGKCYKGVPENCEKYGRFYDWASAMNLDEQFNNESYIGFIYKTTINGAMQNAKKFLSKEEYEHISTISEKLNKMYNEISTMSEKWNEMHNKALTEAEMKYKIELSENLERQRKKYADEVEKYGRELSENQSQGICPEGWRLPNISDFETITSLGNKEAENLVKETEKRIKEALEARGESRMTKEEEQMLANAEKKAQEIKENSNKKLKPLQLGGTDEYGINAKPGGSYKDGAFQGIGEEFSGWWSSNEDKSLGKEVASMLFSEAKISSKYKKELGHIRCVLDPVAVKKAKDAKKAAATKKAEEAKKAKEVAAKPSAPATSKQPSAEPKAEEVAAKSEPIEESEFYPKQEAQPISTNIPQKENNTSFNKSTIIGIAMAVAGAGLAAYGYLCDKNAVQWYENDYQNQTGQQARDTWQTIQDAQKIRNISYGAGGALFLSGLGVAIFF